MFAGAANTFTLPQTFSVTDPGETAGVLSVLITDTVDGTGDPTTIRPAGLVISHHSTLAPVGGVGASIFFTTQDLARTDVRIGKHAVEITDPTPNACISTQAWSVLKNGTEVEVLRIRGGQGMAPTFFAGGSTATGGGAAGLVGGQAWVRGDLLTTGDRLHQKTDAVNNAPLRIATYEHLLSAGSVTAGFGVEHYWQSRDGSNNLVPIARQQMIVTGPTAGAVQSAQIWTVSYNSQEVEVVRIRGGVGMVPTAGASFVAGGVGGEFFLRGDFRMGGQNFGVFGVAPVSRQTGGVASATGSYTSTEQGMINRMYTALQAYGFLT